MILWTLGCENYQLTFISNDKILQSEVIKQSTFFCGYFVWLKGYLTESVVDQLATMPALN